MDNSKLFSDVNPEVYEDVFQRLQELRKDFPAYRDDQLLMYLVCQGYSNWSKTFNEATK